jgi:hypothetical protein
MLGLAKRGILCICIAASLTMLAGAASAAAASPWWHLTTSVRPATIAPGGEGAIVDEATNLGDATATGGVTLSDVLPAGVTVAEEAGKPEISFFASQIGSSSNLKFLCQVAAPRVTCTFPASVPLPAFENLTMLIEVKVGAGSATNLAEVSGGGALPVKVSRSLPVSASAPAFGIEEYAVTPEEDGGAIDAQAGSHPFQLTTTLALNQTASNVAPPALPRNLTFQLPAGLVGNATSVPQCSEADFNDFTLPQNHCPGDTAVGVATVTFYSTTFNTKLASWAMPLFNLVPAYGEPARFGFNVFSTQVTLDTSVRSGADYGVTVSVKNISQTVNFFSTNVTIWGVPGDSRHDESRGWACLAKGTRDETQEPCTLEKQSSPAPFLTLPTSCSEPFLSTVQAESWPLRSDPQAETTTVEHSSAEYSLIDGFGRSLDMTGCNQLAFAPFIEAASDVQETSKPSGLAVHVRVPQEASGDGAGLSGSDVRDITVALPPGVSVNPAGAGGLEACSESDIGYLPGQSEPPGKLDFSSTLPEPLLPGLNLNALGFCPNASKIGTAKITTPLLANPLNGFVYLASQNTNPFGGLLAMYLVAEDPVSGTLVKLPGEASLCQAAGESIAGESCAAAGQLIATFENEPQVPFEDAELHFFGGERAPLSTPARCGGYTTQASFVPWSGNAPVAATSTFKIEHGAGGGPCPGQSLPFAPSLTGGSTNISSGGFTPLTTTIGREDGNQDMQSVQLHFPPGLSGVLAGMKLCPEAQANAGTCGSESQIGETTVSAGVGSQPVSVKGGKVYLTEKYDGAPFGLSIVDPVKTGPFDLEHDTSRPTTNMPACDCVVVRAKVEVNPTTAALTVATDSSGAHVIPHLIDGIPVQIQKVNVLINRPGFSFNPTNCDPMKIEGAITSDEGATSPVNVPFQVTNCGDLAFKPSFSAATAAKTSRKNGASLKVKLVPPAEGPQHAIGGSNGSSASAKPEEANIKLVKVELPRQLPSRLTTLQKACTAQQFEANPAGCPSASMVGMATARTPLLSSTLAGPAYFVSRGNEAFPQLIIVLQGEGVTVDVVGNTFISKAGITSSTFASVPDVPVTSFELTLPEGPYSALAANVNLCRQPLSMPTEFMAQNGARVKQDTPIEVEGCPNALAFTSHRIKGRTLTLSVYAPGAGSLTVGGKGLKPVTKTAKRRETIAFKLTQKQAGSLATTVKATFMPNTGKDRRKQAKSLHLRFSK